MSTLFDATEIPERKRHVYFFAILILLTVLAGTIKHRFDSEPSFEQKELADGAKRILESGSVVKDLYARPL